MKVRCDWSIACLSRGAYRCRSGRRGPPWPRYDAELHFAPRFDYGRLIPISGAWTRAVSVRGPGRSVPAHRCGPARRSPRRPRPLSPSPPANECHCHLVGTPPTPLPEADRSVQILGRTEAWWRQWAGRCRYEGPHQDRRAAVADHAEGPHILAHRCHCRGAHHVAAGRDRRATELGLPVLLAARRRVALVPLRPPNGLSRRGRGLGRRLLRFSAPSPAIPSNCRPMYGIGGEHRLTELELPWLSGYEGSKPVSHR